MVFYFPFLILYFLFFIYHQDDSIAFMKNHKQYVDSVIGLWVMAVLISLPLSSSYVYEGETRGFVSFAGTTFLLCPIAIFVFALLAVYHAWYNKNISGCFGVRVDAVSLYANQKQKDVLCSNCDSSSGSGWNCATVSDKGKIYICIKQNRNRHWSAGCIH